MYSESEVVLAEKYIDTQYATLDANGRQESSRSSTEKTQLGLRQQEEKLISLQKEVFVLKLQLYHYKNQKSLNLNKNNRIVADLEIENERLNEELKSKRVVICHAARVLQELQNPISSITMSECQIALRNDTNEGIVNYYENLLQEMKNRVLTLTHWFEKRENEFKTREQIAYKRIRNVETNLSKIKSNSEPIIRVKATEAIYLKKYRIISDGLHSKRGAAIHFNNMPFNDYKQVFDKLRSIHLQTKLTNKKLIKLMETFRPTHFELAIKCRAQSIAKIYDLN